MTYFPANLNFINTAAGPPSFPAGIGGPSFGWE